MAYKTIFLTVVQVIWGWGRLGIYLNVANDFPSTLRDERETMHLNFNSPMDSSCQKEHTSNSQKSKIDHLLSLGAHCRGELPCLEHRYLRVECELSSWQSDLISPLKCPGQHNAQVHMVNVSIIK